MSSFQEARAALVRTIRAVFPDARPAPRWAGVEAWAAPRPEGAVRDASTGTYDPRVTVVGIADRKSGPTVYFLDPGDYHALDTHRDLLEGAGFKLGRGCIMHTRKGPLPTEALQELFRRVKARDARAARGAASKTKAPARMAAGADTVDAYLAALPPAQRAALEKLRKQIRAAAPKATEKMAYGMPTFVHEGNLVHMAAFKAHCSFFPGRGGVAEALMDDLQGFEVAKGTIRFAPAKPIPAALVKRIVRMRVAENEARAAARKAKKPAKKKATRKKAPRRA